MGIARPTTTMSAGRLPDFIVIGATKAGTTSLNYYLSLHPDVYMARPKEPRFFVDAPEPVGRYSLGLEWYRGQFVTPKTIAGESTPLYTQFPWLPGVPERMARHVPEAKLIYLVRDPMARLQSHFAMLRRLHLASASFEDELNTDDGIRLLPASRYGTQYEQFARYYPRSHILVVESDELKTRPRETMSAVFTFLGVDSEFFSHRFMQQRNVSAKQATPSHFGRRALESPFMQWARRILRQDVYHHMTNIALLPFSVSPPITELSDKMTARLYEEFRHEVAELRQLTGLALPSLGYCH
jgi:hypothetical protein